MLITKARIRNRNSWRDRNGTLPLLRAVSFTPYLPFGAGTLPAALLSFINSTERKIFGQVTVNERKVGYLVRESQEIALVGLLNERAAISAMDTPGTICFAIDHDAECFFFNSPLGRTLLETTLPESCRVLRMNSRPVRAGVETLVDILNRSVPDQKCLAYVD